VIHLYGVNRLSGNYRVILEMNERLKLGSRKLVANVRLWVEPAGWERLSDKHCKTVGGKLARKASPEGTKLTAVREQSLVRPCLPSY